MLAALPEYHPFFDPFPQSSLLVSYHNLPISNPADNDDDDDDGSAYAEANSNGNLSSDDDIQYEDDDVPALCTVHEPHR